MCPTKKRIGDRRARPGLSNIQKRGTNSAKKVQNVNRALPPAKPSQRCWPFHDPETWELFVCWRDHEPEEPTPYLSHG